MNDDHEILDIELEASTVLCGLNRGDSVNAASNTLFHLTSICPDSTPLEEIGNRCNEANLAEVISTRKRLQNFTVLNRNSVAYVDKVLKN